MNFIAGDAVGVSLTSDTIDLLLVDYSCKSASNVALRQEGVSHVAKMGWQNDVNIWTEASPFALECTQMGNL